MCPLRLSPSPTHLRNRHLRLTTAFATPAGVFMRWIDNGARSRPTETHAVLGFRRKGEPNLRGFGFAFGALALLDLERDFVWLISANDLRISETVDEPLNRKIVGIEEAFAD